ncbi:MAG: polyprenol monophosphomannose synthase [Chloroflexi bacterium]|nr:polyprenol monophosphomannose synthase [Chloroflexota bacterium]
MDQIGIVIPTYNERENIGALVQDLLTISRDLHVLVVDDNSPDGTGAVADEIAAGSSRVRVIHRHGKGGRGSACIEGFQRFLAEGEVDTIMEMDADFSHAPSDVPAILTARDKADVVIGSRYVTRSKIVGWSIKRRIFSRLANFFAGAILGVPINDYTNGFRCYTRDCLQALDMQAIRSTGYIVLTEIAYQIHRRGFTFHEVPTLFVNRQRGASNVSFKEIRNAFSSVLRLKLESMRHRERSGAPQVARARQKKAR